jgi:hypothetical protein
MLPPDTTRDNQRAENANHSALAESLRGRRLDELITPSNDLDGLDGLAFETGARNCAGLRNMALTAACRDAAFNRRFKKKP